MKTLIIFLILFPIISLAAVLDETIAVNPHSLPGDSEKNSLGVEGVRLHEANDFYGKTDKLISEAAGLSVMGIYYRYFSTQLSYKGRFVQPVLRTKDGEGKLAKPLGIYAEWEETYLNQSVTLFNEGFVAFKLDGGVGYNDFGRNGFTQLYRKIHKGLNAPDESKDFPPITRTSFISSSYGGSLIFALAKHLNLMTSYSIFNSRIFREDASEATLIYSISKDLAFTFKYSFIHQIRSDFYDIKNNREQMNFGVRLFKFWTPSIQYVSTYIKGDKHGQYYLSPLSLTYPF